MAYQNLLTKQGEKLLNQLKENPAFCPWDVYPRPQMRRDSYFCLNGKWDFCAADPSVTPMETILVPFPPESILSGIGRFLGKDPSVYYRRSFRLPDGFWKDRVLLHFGAADQIARVCINGKDAGTHVGGYDAFCLDITELLEVENTIEVFAEDKLSEKILPYGKQSYQRGGMWYTPITGIWQTVWLESVPETYIRHLTIESDTTSVRISAEGIRNGIVRIHTNDGDLETSLENGKAAIQIPSPHLWTPEDPYLYTFSIQSGEDTVHSYFALRSFTIQNFDNIPRLCLNGKPYFWNGVLDQGYFSDGIYTSASPESYTEDILAMKSLGFNTLRKHIKVEPEAFYYECDRLGMLVIQDMVNNGDYNFLRDTALPTLGLLKRNDRHLHKNKAQRAAFAESAERTIRQLQNHPSICCWTIFNEGWGQFDGSSQYTAFKQLDSGRMIDTVSGWFKGAESDLESIHIYFKPIRIHPGEKPVLLSEFGGYSLKIPEHAFNTSKTYGYRKYKDPDSFRQGISALYRNEILPAVKDGLCGAICTQLSDVEDETNGFLTYDRKVCKADPEEMRRIACDLQNILQVH